MTQGRAFRVLLIVVVAMCVVISAVAMFVAYGSQQTSSGVAELAARRPFTVDALEAFQRQSKCVDQATVGWMVTLTVALLQPSGSPEQADAIEALRPNLVDLESVMQRCYDENPVPAADVERGAGSSTAAADGEGGGADAGSGTPGRDGRDGRDGRAGTNGVDGADGSPGAPGVAVAGSPGAAGRDGADGANGVSVAGPVGPQGEPGPAGADGAPGESVTGPTGPQGPPGFDGAPPVGWSWTDANGDTFECSDPDGDSHYTCPMVAPPAG